MDGMSPIDRLEDSLTSKTLRLQEYLHSANITDDDLDYYFNYTGLLPATVLVQQPGGTLAGGVAAGADDGAPVESSEYDYSGCGLGLHKIRSSVQLIHGCLSLIICLAGCLANIVNIVVLSRRELRRNAINRILCSLAVADFLLMLEYIPFACHMYLFPGRTLQAFYSYPWAVFVLFHAHFTLVAHTVSIWLTLSLAFWRYEVLKNGRHQRRKAGRRCHQERCTRTIVLAYVGSVLLCIPSFITFGIEQQQVMINSDANHTLPSLFSSAGSSVVPQQPPVPHQHETASLAFIYTVDLNPIAKKHDDLIHKAHLWAYSVVMKLGPCLVLTVLTCWLVRRLWEAESHHQSLTAKLNAMTRQQGSATDRAPPGTAAYSTLASAGAGRHHHDRDNQISLTQQLEMRQLNSVMNRDSGVQIIVTEAAVSDDPADVLASATIHAAAATNAPIKLPGGPASPTRIPQPPQSLPTLQQDRSGRRKQSAEYSSFLQTSTRDDAVSKTEATQVELSTNDAEDASFTAPADPSGSDRSPAVPSRVQVTSLNSTKSLRHKHQTDRTTRMLVAVLVLFLVTEIPQGVMALLSGLLGRQFFTRCYTNGMGEILDLLALLNSAINFLLYCSMSRQFRRAARSQFRRLFGTLTAAVRCQPGPASANCFNRTKLLQQPQPVTISPSNPTRCTQL